MLALFHWLLLRRWRQRVGCTHHGHVVAVANRRTRQFSKSAFNLAWFVQLLRLIQMSCFFFFFSNVQVINLGDTANRSIGIAEEAGQRGGRRNGFFVTITIGMKSCFLVPRHATACVAACLCSAAMNVIQTKIDPMEERAHGAPLLLGHNRTIWAATREEGTNEGGETRMARI